MGRTRPECEAHHVEPITDIPQRYAQCRNTHVSAFTCLTTEFPHAWELEASYVESRDDDDDDDDGSGSEDGDDTRKDLKLPKQIAVPKSKAYPEFLQFLELGCGGSPLQGYPAALVILSTIPPSVRRFHFLNTAAE